MDEQQLREAYEDLNAQYEQLQYLVAFLLHENDNLMFVSEKTMKEGTYENKQIAVEPDADNEGINVRLVDIDE